MSDDPFFKHVCVPTHPVSHVEGIKRLDLCIQIFEYVYQDLWPIWASSILILPHVLIDVRSEFSNVDSEGNISPDP